MRIEPTTPLATNATAGEPAAATGPSAGLTFRDIDDAVLTQLQDAESLLRGAISMAAANPSAQSLLAMQGKRHESDVLSKLQAMGVEDLADQLKEVIRHMA